MKTYIPDDLPALRVDGLLVEQMLVNLLENAAKYTPEQSLITLTARPLPENWIEVILEDNGPGIPLHGEERIFEKFVAFPQQQSARSTGLGLTICRAIIHAHRGKIHASNRAEGGACFTFTLPASRPPQLETEAA